MAALYGCRTAAVDGPPDLDELWRDFNIRLSGLFAGRGGNDAQAIPGAGRRGAAALQPDARSAGIGLGLILLVTVLVWLGSGVFIVQEGQRAVVTSFDASAPPWMPA